MTISVIKANGEREPFSEAKLRHSISRAGVPGKLHDQVLAHVKDRLRNDIPTQEIFGHILEYLGKSSYPHTATRYSLKKAIMDLGPTGFPFEKFIAAILDHQGYHVETNAVLSGLCISHEVDIMANKEGQKIMIECKFHNNIGNRTDVKVALYVFARYQDLTTGWMNKSNATRFNQVWLITNTKVTVDAIAYARCMGMKIISWGYPEYGNLQELIEKDKLLPITCLSSISAIHKKILLDNNIILAKDLLSKEMFIDILNLSKNEKQILLSELKSL